MAHWFHIEFYNSVATVETDCSGLCRVTMRKNLAVVAFKYVSLFLHLRYSKIGIIGVTMCNLYTIVGGVIRAPYVLI